jgi:mycothiol system anti-sigma-R factor
MTDSHRDGAAEEVPGDCAVVLSQVYLFLDDECDDERRTIIAEHLDACSPCLEHFGVEHELKELVHRSCGGDQAPDSLRVSVRARLSQVNYSGE